MHIHCQRFDLLPELQLIKPPRRNRVDSPRCPQYVPGDRPGAVAITAVVYSEPDPRFEISGDERAVQGNGERFFGRPASAQGFKRSRT